MVKDGANLLRTIAVAAVAVAIAGGAGAVAIGSPSRGAGAGLNAGPRHLEQPAGAVDGRADHVPGSGRYTFLLKLANAPTTRVFDGHRADGLRAARAAARAQLTRIAGAQRDLITELPPHSPVLYRTHSVLAGVAVTTDVHNARALADLPDVAAVYPVAPKFLDNSYAVPFQGAPQVWTTNGDTGQNTTIAIIDTGIDYTHANFGGPGTVAAYTTAHAAEAAPANPALFPSAKVIGGYDFVGDAYNDDTSSASYDPVPHPDGNPLDCNGHGSHVAGTAAGLGENADGTTYRGTYDSSTPVGTMKIGPGMAPGAKLYAYRVLGCSGTAATSIISAAIDRASDPNDDGDPSDHVDVINLSLSSNFGSPDDGDAIAANDAVDLGISVSISAGNGGDVTDIGGSPGTASKAITVADSQDAASTVDGVSVTIDGNPQTYAATRAALYDWTTGADLSGSVVLPPPGTSTTACDPYPAGTFTGAIALIEAGAECGSTQRAANLEAAGAKGFILANSTETFATGINGSATIPGVLIAKSGGDAIRTALGAATAVTVTGTAANAITQLFTDDNDKLNSSSSRGTRAPGNVKPDVAAVGTSVFSTAVGTGSDGRSMSGTSMAAPMVAGLAALVHTAHPDWTPNEVKADIMNTAGQDVYVDGAAHPSGGIYGPARVGAGRIEADAALANDVLAYDGDDAGTVSVSFGAVEVTGPIALTRHITVKNTSLSTVTYKASYDPITVVPGVSYSVTPSTVVLTPRGSDTLTVTLTVTDPAQMTKTVDPTIGRLTALGRPRETLAEASGRVLLTSVPSGRPTLRVPIYAAPRPASVMTQAATLQISGAGSDQTAPLTLTGQDLGSGMTNGVGDGDPDNDIFSLAAGFELQASSGLAPQCGPEILTDCYRIAEERDADLRDVGYTSDYPLFNNPSDSLAYFAVSTQGPWSTPSDKATLEIAIDVDGDNVPDLFLYNTRLGTDDEFVSELYDPGVGVIDDEPIDERSGDTDAALYDSDTMILPLYLGALVPYGITAAHPRIFYGVTGYSAYSSHPIDVIGIDPATGHLSHPLTANLYAPGVRVLDSGGDGPLMLDTSGAVVTVHRDPASYRADHGQGVLMAHLHNRVGDKTQVVTLHGIAQAISIGSTPSSPGPGHTYSPTATGGGSGLPIVFSSATPTVCTVAAATVSFVAVGTCTIHADQAGDDSYEPAATVTQTITVAPNAQTVTITSSPPTAQPGGTYALTATGGGSGLPVVFSSATPGVCAVSAATVTYLAVGDCIVHADQGANADYAAAPTAGQTITVVAAPPPPRVNPRISAHVASAHAKSRYGWYRSPVTVTFTCTAGSGALTGSCPRPATLSHNGPRQSLSRSIAASDGGRAAITVSGLNIDTTAPTITITGVRPGATYSGTLPRVNCVARDALSKVASCRIATRTKRTTVRYTATAIDRAGNVRTARITVHTAR